MQYNGSKQFDHKLLLHLTLGWGQKVKIQLFSEHGHVLYRIKRNDECSNMQANTLSLHTHATPGMGSKVKTFFMKVVMLHVKLK